MPRPKSLPSDCAGLHLHKQESWSLISTELNQNRGEEGKALFCHVLKKNMWEETAVLQQEQNT